jgi:histidinol-phosphate aminotransferase
MAITFAEKLARIPGYQAGVPTGQAPEQVASGEIAQLASNESPFPPHPKVIEAIQAASVAMNRYPDPDATLLRRRLAERFETEPGRVAVGNGSCELLLAAAEALCEPGAEIVYAWPSFSMYPYLAALTGAREIRVPLAEGEVHDLDAMAEEVTAATQLLVVCNPNNPTATHIPAAEIAAFCERIPPHVTIVLDEAYIEFQTVDDPDRTLDLLPDFPNLVVMRTFSKCFGLAGLRVGYALGPAKFRAAIDAVRQPFSVNALAQAAGAEAILHSDDVERRVEANIVERVRVESGLDELGIAHAESQTNFSWLDLAGADEPEVVAYLGAERSIAVRPGALLGEAGRLRVSYGTPAENERLLAALGELLG